MLSVRVSKGIEDRLELLSSKTNRSKSYFVKRALERYLEDEEDMIEAVASYEDYLRSGKSGYTIEEMKHRYGIE